MRYVIVTPAKDEENYIEYTIKSICKQTVLPLQWLIVDDGSKDRTFEIIRDYARRYDWIKVVRRESIKEKRAPGPKIISAFYFGMENIDYPEYEILVKLDADLTLPEHYFEQVLYEFRKDSNLGICGGICTVRKGEVMVREPIGDLDHLRGPIKSYRLGCFHQIGGIKKTVGWDSLDELMAQYYGWKVRVLPQLKVIHHRPTTTETGRLRASYRFGRALYSMRYGPLFSLTSSIKWGLQKPYIVSGLIAYCGYLTALLGSEKKIIDKEIGKYIRQYRKRKILHKMGLYKNINSKKNDF